jgi:hypothetical protein
MRERLTNTEPPQFLSGWKEIANYLHSSVRSVQRYEHAGLPAYRPVPGNRSHVVANSVDIDRWLHRRYCDQRTGLVIEVRNNQQEHQRQLQELRRRRAELKKNVAQLRSILTQVGQLFN